ncbi:activating signal cointegrator 1 complex subunit 2 [Leptopilina boulardi]|uniref:activating signal cointegrator 1 complex subunit 2 n=1 Tax=Leptopilina boulardi TaxID=63433 RepID=UPI0021F5692E|nr:activating signal cointegrator 1 complex subunit 2 [Leptopilina boulardi]
MENDSMSPGFFQNPECKPLEDLQLTLKNEGIPELVSALNKRWVVDRYFLYYEAPIFNDSNDHEIVGAKEHWMEIVNYIIDDLIWLLKLPYFRFWSNIIHNTSIMEMLISFLQEAPPYYALDDFPNSHDVREILNKLRHYVLLIFARLVTNKESSEEFMTRLYHGNLLYDNFIFTVPIILDLCQQYGRENKKTIDKLLKTLFILQPLYRDDFKRAISFFVQVFSNLERRFEETPNDVILLTEGVKKQSKEISLTILEDLIVHILDVSSNLTIFLENYPPATELFQTSNFMTKIVTVYSNTIPKMYEKLDSLAMREDKMIKYIELKHRLDVSRVELLKLYRIIIYKNIADILETGIELEIDMKKRVENYLDHVTNAISEKEFITDYHRFYPIDVDLEILSQICPEVDTIKCDFILNSIHATIVDEKSVNNSYKDAVASCSGINPPQQQQQHQQQQLEIENFDSREQEKIKPNEEELVRLMSEVKEILCHLGDGFIERCLKHYNYDSTRVINAVLEETLPSDLKELDFSLPYIPPDPEEAAAAVDSAFGAQRLNVFDNDEFDIMTNDKIDMSRIHRGKRKDKYKDVNEMLNDKNDIKKVNHIYSKYNLVSYEYDDEYDDTYDSHDIGETAQDDTLEMDRPFTTPRVLLRKGRDDEIYEDDDDDDENEELTEAQTSRDYFVQNPAELRAKAEQRYFSKRGGRGGSQQKDVVGNAKGQGQEKNVVINRDHKNTNKSTRANHNRRVGSQWKRRQGMIPS